MVTTGASHPSRHPVAYSFAFDVRRGQQPDTGIGAQVLQQHAH